MRIQISIPNDYGSEKDEIIMINDVYGGDTEAAADDEGFSAIEELAWIARQAGLKPIEPTPFGLIFEGTEAQIKECIQALPEWAYYGIIEEE